MTITVYREFLFPALLKVVGVVEKKQTLPILGNILFKIKDEKMLLIGTDSEIEIRTTTDIERDDETEIAFTVSARKFHDISKALPENAQIHITIDDERIIIRSGRSRFSLGTLPAEDFPSLEITPADYSFTVEANFLKRLLKHTHFSMGYQDVRYCLNGLLLDLTSERLRCVATDGHRLALSEGPITCEQERQILLPRKAVQELIRVLDNYEHEVTVETSLGFCRFKIGETIFTTKLIDGQFPNYQRVIPKNMENTATFARKPFKEAMLRSAILSPEKQNGIKLTFTPGELQMEATNTEQEDAFEELEIEYNGDEEVTIGFNVVYFIDVLNALDCENVVMEFENSSSSALLRDPDDNDRLYVVMPMRL
ncbi:hypothetical protein TI05_05965 [Achromatium sp. WMS3]|nr:hypothetical protein TI05_05965 [Achromatium sp. WMS3]